MTRAATRFALGGRLCMAAATAAALYLAGMALSGNSLAGCESDGPCGGVMSSQWAYSFGMPVSFAGLIAYGAVLYFSGAFVRRERSFSGFAGTAAAAAAVAAAVWFAVVQIFILKSYCLWCCAAHGLALTGALLLWRSRALHPAQEAAGRHGLPACGVALAGIAALAAGSWLTPRPPTDSGTTMSTALSSAPQTTVRGLALYGGRVVIDPAAFPVIGKASAVENTAFLVGDFTCEHCRTLYASLTRLAGTSPVPFRVIVLPGVHSEAGAEIQRTMLTLFHADPAEWSAAADMLSSRRIPASPDAVGKAALKMLGSAKFSKTAIAAAGKIEAQMETARGLQNANDEKSGTSVLPQLLRDKQLISGAEGDPARLLAFLTSPAGAPSGNPATQLKGAPRPVLALTQEMVKLDALVAGKPREFQVKVENRGNAPMRLGYLTLESGCEVTSLPSTMILPNETGVIGLRFTPPSAGGDFTRKLLIHSDAEGEPASVILRGSTAAKIAHRH